MLCNEYSMYKGGTCWVLISLEKSVFKSQSRPILLRLLFPLCRTAEAVSRNVLSVSSQILLQLGVWVAALMGLQL